MEVFDEEVANIALPESSWERADFARDLYLDELVTRCLVVSIDGRVHSTSKRYLTRAIAQPPSDVRDVHVRRAVLAELAESPLTRRQLEKVYLGIVRLRGLLCASRQPAPRVRRVEILRASREVFERLAQSFEECEFRALPSA